MFERFSHEQLSMLASHLAAGGAVCCPYNADVRSQICGGDGRKMVDLSDFAYERMGCYRFGEVEPEFGERMQAHYFNNFLKAVEGIL